MGHNECIATALHRFEDGAIGPTGLLRQLAMGVAEELLCERVGIWTFDVHDGQLALRCLCQYDLRGVAFTEGQVLSADLTAGYFAELAECGVLVASDARSHPATRQLAATYLEPLDIHSILDVAFTSNGHWTGILGCEQVGAARAWKQRDVAFVRTVASRASLVIERTRAGGLDDEADVAAVRMASGRDISVAHLPWAFTPRCDGVPA
jgi:GAF domain-containing protein